MIRTTKKFTCKIPGLHTGVRVHSGSRQENKVLTRRSGAAESPEKPADSSSLTEWDGDLEYPTGNSTPHLCLGN